MKLAAIILVALVLAVAGGLAMLGAIDRRAARTAWHDLAARDDWRSGVFDPAMVAGLPEPAQRYFLYTIAPGTPIATTARIVMTGEIGLGTRDAPGYRPVEARQILAPPHGFVWKVSLPQMSGSDGMTPDSSWTRFRLFGLVPVVRATGADHLRSSLGRVIAEGAMWTPAAFLPGPGVEWQAVDETTARAVVRYGGFEQAVDITVAEDGRPLRVSIPRWSNANPDKEWRIQPFGGPMSEFRDFGGYHLPTAVEGGNFFGTEDYFPFYRARVTDISFTDLSY